MQAVRSELRGQTLRADTACEGASTWEARSVTDCARAAQLETERDDARRGAQVRCF